MKIESAKHKEKFTMANEKYTSIVKLDFQYAHRFMNWPCEAKHLHGHSGLLEIEIENTVDPVTGYAHACKEGFKKAWKFAIISITLLCFKKVTRFLRQF